MKLRNEFRRVIASILLVWAAKVTPDDDVITHMALVYAGKAMVKDDERRGVKLREFKVDPA